MDHSTRAETIIRLAIAGLILLLVNVLLDPFFHGFLK